MSKAFTTNRRNARHLDKMCCEAGPTGVVLWTKRSGFRIEQDWPSRRGRPVAPARWVKK